MFVTGDKWRVSENGPSSQDGMSVTIRAQSFRPGYGRGRVTADQWAPSSLLRIKANGEPGVTMPTEPV